MRQVGSYCITDCYIYELLLLYRMFSNLGTQIYYVNFCSTLLKSYLSFKILMCRNCGVSYKHTTKLTYTQSVESKISFLR